MNAKSEIMLSDTPRIGMRKNEPQNEMKMPRLTQKATAGRRKMPSTVTTSSSPIRPFFPRIDSRSR